MKYLAVLEYGPRNYSAYILDVPGCIATGKTLEAVTQSISEALAVHLDGETPPPLSTLDAEGLELAERDSVAWIEPAPMNPVSLELERILKQKRFFTRLGFAYGVMPPGQDSLRHGVLMIGVGLLERLEIWAGLGGCLPTMWVVGAVETRVAGPTAPRRAIGGG